MMYCCGLLAELASNEPCDIQPTAFVGTQAYVWYGVEVHAVAIIITILLAALKPQSNGQRTIIIRGPIAIPVRTVTTLLTHTDSAIFLFFSTLCSTIQIQP